MIDLRSDTVTKPSKEMLNVILESEVGDDEYKEDPTVNDLEDFCAELLGFESGLFVGYDCLNEGIAILPDKPANESEGGDASCASSVNTFAGFGGCVV